MDHSAFRKLKEAGIASIEGNKSTNELFAAVRPCLGAISNAASDSQYRDLAISADADAGTVSGVHGFGVMSNYNTCRAGIVMSNGKIIDIPGWNDPASFRSFGASICREVYKAIEDDLGLEEGWFEKTFGDAEESCQWHVKVYSSGTVGETEEGAGVRLPVHTDPSLISIVLHDVLDRVGGMGLEYLARRQDWREVDKCGHNTATVIVGSVLEKITGGRYKAARHRVVEKSGEEMGEERVAATFFFRPGPNKILQVPPSPILEGTKVKEMPFGTWLRKTSKRYQKTNERIVDRAMDKKERGERKGKGEEMEGFVNRKQRKARKLKERLEREKAEKGLPKPPPSSKPIIDPPIHNHCGSACQLIGDEIIGQEKYLGGECGSDGRIYAIPGCAPQVLRIDPTTGCTDLVGPVMKGEFKWLRSVKAIDGDGNEAIYGLPCHASSVLKIVPATGKITTFGELGDQEWKYHGGNLAEGKRGLRIWCIPQKATRVMAIDPKNDTVELIGPELPGICKWYGGLPGIADGCIYGMPQNAAGVLKINPKTEEISVMGKLKEGGHKWHGGLLDGEGNIWAIPANADGILKVDVKKQEIKIIGDGEFQTGSHRDDGKYKFLGGVKGADGNLYMIPCDADYVVQVNPKTEEIKNIGPNLKDNIYVQTKWQNGFSAEDGSIYCVPLKGEKVLCIRPHKLTEDGTPEVDLIGGPYISVNKWEGGVVGPDGACYCMPLGHRRVLRISPPGGNVLKPNNGVMKADVAALRSSNHIVGYSRARKNDEGPKGGKLPEGVRARSRIVYDTRTIRMREVIADMLKKKGAGFINEGWNGERLEDLSLREGVLRKKDKGKSQRGLTEVVDEDEAFRTEFRKLVDKAVLPWMKRKIDAEAGEGGEGGERTFYIQDPPTLRIQPGPCARSVTPHNDAQYGHQPGELNFWVPFTDVQETRTTLWVEENEEKGDFTSLDVNLGEVGVFFGTLHKHFVPANVTNKTRVSIDFRIGVEGWFDTSWSMKGTKDKHERRIIKL